LNTWRANCQRAGHSRSSCSGSARPACSRQSGCCSISEASRASAGLRPASARLDLRHGPLLLTLPAMPNRYRSVQLMNFHTDNLAILGSRPQEQGALEVLVLGPGQPAPAALAARATHQVQADTFDAWLLIRTLVDGPDDLPAVAALQDQMRLVAPRPAADYPAQRRAPPREVLPEAFVAVVNEFLERNPPQGGMAAITRAAFPLSLRRAPLASHRPDAPLLPSSAQPWPAALASLRNPALMIGRRAQGWEFPPAEVGRIGDGSSNLPLRATVALRAIAALDAREALYLAASVDSDGKPLDGRQRFRVRLPAGGLASGAFWSLSMYEVMPDGRAFFVSNPLRRFSIGSRTPGLQPQADGSLTLLLQHAAPADGTAHWLPAPAGPFRLMLRAYLPTPALAAGEAPLPRVERQADP